MIIFHESVETVKSSGILYGRPEAVRSLAISLMLDIAESNTDMICDMPEEFPTKDKVEAAFRSVNETALDLLDEHFEELVSQLRSYLATIKVDARVRRLEYDTAGCLSDVAVEFNFG